MNWRRLDVALLGLAVALLLLAAVLGLTSLASLFADAAVGDALRAWREEDRALTGPVQLRLALRGGADRALAQRQADLRAGRPPVTSLVTLFPRSYGEGHIECSAALVDEADGTLRVEVTARDVARGFDAAPPADPVTLDVRARVTADAVDELSAR